MISKKGQKCVLMSLYQSSLPLLLFFSLVLPFLSPLSLNIYLPSARYTLSTVMHLLSKFLIITHSRKYIFTSKPNAHDFPPSLFSLTLSLSPSLYLSLNWFEGGTVSANRIRDTNARTSSPVILIHLVWIRTQTPFQKKHGVRRVERQST